MVELPGLEQSCHKNTGFPTNPTQLTMKHLILPLIGALFLAQPALAQSPPELFQAYSLNPSLVIRGEDGEPYPLEIKECSIEVRLYGCVAETQITLEFYNPSENDEKEGRFLFPLPEGATVDGYALDIDGELVDGVAVEKQQAKTVFETIQRRGIDPGGWEATPSNAASTRCLAESGGGRCFAWNNETPESITAKLDTPDLKLLQVEFADAEASELSWANLDENLLFVAGRLNGRSAKLRLHFGDKTTVLETVEQVIEATDNGVISVYEFLGPGHTFPGQFQYPVSGQTTRQP